ncbi:zinc finger protein 511-like protein [Trifolium pratense]|uniref:Zinc finger protein 511-like protein n=1 Tax=Trifolium pratense TaxID=57577 RepID=A0A2K3N2X7_TRIPR|nr:zinc finger protein 511-like protein [Trifolium pratense]
MDVENQNPDSEFPFWKPIPRRFQPDSPFFAIGNLERELLVKQVALELTEEKEQLEDLIQEDVREVFCPIVGCGARLASMEDFENHYNARHTASCSVCFRVYPTSRLLSIHVSEAHDSFFQAKVARGYDMYECLVEGCGLKFKSYKSRHQHLVDKHKFPTSFEFFKKALPSKKHRMKSQRKKPSHSHKEDTSGMMEVENAAIDDLVSAVSKLNTSDSTPSSISFGRRNPKGMTFVPRAVQRGKGSNSDSSVTKR